MVLREGSGVEASTCPKCRAAVKDNWKHCPSCGGPLSGTMTPSQNSDPLESGPESIVSLEEKKMSHGNSHGLTRLGDRYEMREVIGRGGMGVVYLARDMRLDRLVAVKRTLKADDRGIKRFIREARSAAKLNHENIVTVYDAGEDEDGPWITMEFIPGGLTLKDRVEDHGPLSESEVISIGISLCRALAYAHRAGLIHRDVKPGNVLFTREGTSKLSDFGLVREGNESDLSMTGFGMGTKEYAAPEQLKDAKSVDHRADIYGLGATLYFLLTGESPRTIRSDSIPLQLRDIVLKAVAERPEHRFYSADEMRNVLDDPGSAVFTSVQQTRVNRSDFHCPQCNTINPTERRYCLSCGEGLFTVCPKCETEDRIGVQFCGKCGIDIPAWARSEEHLVAARRQMGKRAFKNAVKEAESVLQVFPSREEARVLRDEAKKKLVTVHSLRTKARDLEGEERFEEVEKTWRRLLALVPDDEEAARELTALPEKIRKRDFKKATALIQSQIKGRDWPGAKKTINRMRQLAGTDDKGAVSSMVRALRDALLADLGEQFNGAIEASRFETCSSLLLEMEKLNADVSAKRASLQGAEDEFHAMKREERRARRMRRLCAAVVIAAIGAVAWFGYTEQETWKAWLGMSAVSDPQEFDIQSTGTGEGDHLSPDPVPNDPRDDRIEDQGDPVRPDDTSPPLEEREEIDPRKVMASWLAELEGASPDPDLMAGNEPPVRLLRSVSDFVDGFRNARAGIDFCRIDTGSGGSSSSAFVRTRYVQVQEPVTRPEVTFPARFASGTDAEAVIAAMNHDLYARCAEAYPGFPGDIASCFGFRLTSPEEHRAVFNGSNRENVEILAMDVKGEGYEWLGAGEGPGSRAGLYAVSISGAGESRAVHLAPCKEVKTTLRRLRYTFHVDRAKILEELLGRDPGQ